MRSGKRDGISWRRQEVDSFPDQHLQINFKRLSIKQHDRAYIPLGSGGAIQFELPEESLGRILEGP
jgi:hypothetical protein